MYEDLSNSELLRDAEECCFPFGSDFLPDVVTKTQGLYFWTASGAKVMDWTSGQMSCLLGHGHPEAVEAVRAHAAELDHLYSGMLSPPVIQLAKTLTGLLPPGLDQAMLLSTGGESNECAIRLARCYTGKFEVVGLSLSWHGMTGGAIGAQYNGGRQGAGPLMPGMHMLAAPHSYRSIFRHADGTHDWQTELDYGWTLIDKASCGSLAAAIVEPVMSSGGMLALPSGYLLALQGHCRARGMLLIVDEAQTALGRSADGSSSSGGATGAAGAAGPGSLFAFQHRSNAGVQPDILTLSKTLGNGLPLSAVITSAEVARGARDRGGFLFYTTYANDPLPAAVGLSVLRVILRDDCALLARAAASGARLHAGLQRLRARYACVGEVRGRGLMAGLEIVRDRRVGSQPDVSLDRELSAALLARGLSAMITARSVFAGCIRIAPPVVTAPEDIDRGLRIFEEAFSATQGSLPLYPEDAPAPAAVDGP